MTTDEIVTRIKETARYGAIDTANIIQAVTDAVERVKAYPFDDSILGYATYLYACHLLFNRELKSKYKSVKAENSEFTKFDDANTDDAWKEFRELLKELGIGRNVVHFY